MTLPTLIHVARNVIRESWLVCPDCGGEIVLRRGVYVCAAPLLRCAFASTSLRALDSVPKEPE